MSNEQENNDQSIFNQGQFYTQLFINTLERALRLWKTSQYKNARIEYYSCYMSMSPFLKQEEKEEFVQLNRDVLESFMEFAHEKRKGKSAMSELSSFNQEESSIQKLKSINAQIAEKISEMDMALRKYGQRLGLLLPMKADESMMME